MKKLPDEAPIVTINCSECGLESKGSINFIDDMVAYFKEHKCEEWKAKK